MKHLNVLMITNVMVTGKFTTIDKNKSYFYEFILTDTSTYQRCMILIHHSLLIHNILLIYLMVQLI